MDLVTHALAGGCAAEAAGGTRIARRERLALAAVAAMFPDADFVAFLFDPLRFLAHWHQGPTHSLVLLPLWASLLGAAFSAWKRRWDLFGAATRIAALGLASHIALDAITAYGTQVLYPISGARVALGTTFVIDPVMTLVLGAALLVAARSARRGIAAAGLLLCAAYVGGQWMLKEEAIGVAAGARAGAAPRLDALPQPFSPFNWKLLAGEALPGGTTHVAHVNLAGHRPLVPRLPGLERLHAMAGAYVPRDRLRWESRPHFGDDPQTRETARRLWQRPDFAAFRALAVHPALSESTAQGSPCVWFTDLRYDLPALPDTFRYGYCRGGAQPAWRLARLRYFSEDARQFID